MPDYSESTRRWIKKGVLDVQANHYQMSAGMVETYRCSLDARCKGTVDVKLSGPD